MSPPSGVRVASPPDRPLLVFDGDCSFCRFWVARWKSMTGDRLGYAPCQETAARFPEIPEEEFAHAVQLVLPTGEVFSGAEAAVRTLAEVPGHRHWLAIYRGIPGARVLTEAAYRFIAGHRDVFFRITRLLWGSVAEKPTYFGASSIFVRLVGLCYLAAFLSLWMQVDGLIGPRGILPAEGYLDWIRAQTGPSRYWLVPTLAWLSAKPMMLHGLCAGGVLASLSVFFGFAPTVGLTLAWASYLSLSSISQIFLSYQWDALLLETGLLAIFLSPPAWKLRFSPSSPPSTTALLLLRWLLFRLMFSSGAVKLGSGDPSWRSLTALRAAPRETPRVRSPSRAPDPDRADRQLRVLQLARDRALRAPDRRRVAAVAARAEGARGTVAGRGAAVAGRRDGSRCRSAPDRQHRPARFHGPPFGHGGAEGRRPGRRVAVASSECQPVRPLRGDHDPPARDHRRGKRRRPNVEGLRVSMEARGRRAAAPLRRPASAAPRLADVVRGARDVSRKPLARQLPWTSPAGGAGSAAAARHESLSRRSAALCAHSPLSVPLHGPAVAPLDGSVVEAGARRPVLSDRVARHAAAVTRSGSSDAESVRLPGEAELARGSHVAEQSGRCDDRGAREVSLSADAHPVLPVAVEGGNGALAARERIGSLAEAGSAPGLADRAAHGSKDLRNRFAREPRIGYLNLASHAARAREHGQALRHPAKALLPGRADDERGREEVVVAPVRAGADQRLVEAESLARDFVGGVCVSGRVRLGDHGLDGVEREILVDLVDGVSPRSHPRIGQLLRRDSLRAVPRIGHLVLGEDPVQGFPFCHHVRDRVAVGDRELPVRVHELDRHSTRLLRAPAAEELEDDVFPADPRLQSSLKDDAPLFREGEVDVARRPSEPECRRADSEADRTVGAVCAAVGVRAGYEPSRQHQALLRKVEVEDPVARRRVVRLLDPVPPRELTADRRLSLIGFLARKHEVVVCDRRLARENRVPAGDLVERVNRKRRGTVGSREKVRVNPQRRAGGDVSFLVHAVRPDDLLRRRQPSRGLRIRPRKLGKRLHRAAKLPPSDGEDPAADADLLFFRRQRDRLVGLAFRLVRQPT